MVFPMREAALKNICIVASQHVSDAKSRFPGFQLFTTEDLRRSWKGFIRKHYRFFKKAIFFSYDIETQTRPLFYALILVWISRKDSRFVDFNGKEERITCGSICFRYLPSFLAEIAYAPILLLRVKRDLSKMIGKKLSNSVRNNRKAASKMETKTAERGKIVYFRTDHRFGVRSGGSVGHIKGVAESLLELGYPLFFVSTDRLQFVHKPEIAICVIKPKGVVRNLRELPELEYNHRLVRTAREIFLKERPAIVYQRYSLNNYAGAYLSTEFNVPFVLEYNGSFPWMSTHWGRPLRFDGIAEKIELANLRAADLIVVVSNGMRVELLERGISHDKILVNPNGVNTDIFRPDIDGSPVRRRYGLKNKAVIGFIGTFGQWHGAEVLVESFGKLLQQYPEYRPNVRLYMIGNGVTMARAKENLEKYNATDFAIMTGLVSQEEAPIHLAGCDVLVSPHVPNPDGTPFFGSPTKLFEYMAMGKGIVASNLDQIGQVLEHDKTAWLVEAGDAESLMLGLKHLIDDPALRDRLGRAAREEVVAKYTWHHHASKIADRMEELRG
jgi:glycosyltransferase involved in cell wall biosynthesis